MNCLYPQKVPNPHFKDLYLQAKSNTSGPKNLVLTYTRLVKDSFPYGEPYLDVPCGKCESCLVRRTNEWSFRLFQERKNSKSCYFVTLTYDELNVPRNPITGELMLNKRDCQLFIKRLRKYYGNGIRYFLASEYGENFGRPHYHMLIFNLPIDETKPDWKAKLSLNLFSIWNKGGVDVDVAVDGRIIYCAKYMLSTLDNDAWLTRPKPFILTSRKPGLGANFFEDLAEQRYRYETCDTKCVTEKGIAYPMHRYYKDKFFDDDCKERIKENLAKTFKEPTYHEKIAYKNKIRRNFKKQKRL